MWLYGFWGTDYTMIAGEDDDPLIIFCGTPPGYPFYDYWVRDPSADFGWVYLGTAEKAWPTQPFPYGNSVEPD